MIDYPNLNKVINSGTFTDMELTYRDTLDMICQALGLSMIVEEKQLKLKAINRQIVDIFDEEYLKDVNVSFGKKYGPINSVVLSRSEDTDTIYRRDEISIEEYGLHEFKIKDNLIMLYNDREDYIDEIFEQLNGLEFYINDFTSTGITYLDWLDFYNVQIGNNTYKCLMLDDEIVVNQGLQENIYTEEPQETVTDYKTSSKTDKEVSFIVDKQNQTIESVVSNVGQQDEKILHITQTVDELNSKISNIMNITVSGESAYASVNLQEVNESEPILLKIRPIENNISYLYPRSNLYPSGTLCLTTRKIRFHNTTTDEIIDYELPDNLLYYNTDNYDEFNLSYDSQTCTITKKCKYNADGTIGLLATPTTITYPYPTINLTTGDYEVSILGYSSGYIYATLMASNIYTTQFATKVEMNSAISQTAEEINLEVSKKVGNNEVISKINQSAEAVTISANKIGISGVISAINNNTTTTINGDKITTGSITANQLAANSITSSKVDSSIITTNNLSAQNISANQITSGTLSANRISGGTISGNDVSITNLNASSVTAGTLSVDRIPNLNASKITAGTINANNINVTNINGSNITRGSLSGIPYSYTTNTSKISITNNGDEPLMGYRGSDPRWSLAAFTTGGRFQTFDQNGNVAAYFNQTGAHTSSDIRFKDNITNINEETSMNIINDLTPIEYTYKSCNGYHRGLSAQEVEKVLKENNIEEQVYEINKDGKYSLNYIELIPDLINCIKYLSKEIEKLKESEK